MFCPFSLWICLRRWLIKNYLSFLSPLKENAAFTVLNNTGSVFVRTLLTSDAFYVLPVKRLCWSTNLSWASGPRRRRACCCGAGKAWSAPTISPWPSWTDTSKWRTTWAPSPWCCAPRCASTPTAGYASKPAGKRGDDRPPGISSGKLLQLKKD